jgi:glycosyltransferase involved in cell wall biosynthesis
VLKIANICLSQSFGRLEAFALKFAGDLASRGHEVVSIVPTGTCLSEKVREKGLSQVTVPYPRWHIDKRASLKVRTVTARKGIEVIQAHHPTDLGVLHAALLGLKRPRIFSTASAIPATVSKRGILRNMVYDRVSGVIAATETSKSRTVHSAGIDAEKVRVVPHGFETEAYSLPDEVRRAVRAELGVDDGILIGCIGAIDVAGGQFELQEALRIVLRRFSNVKLVVVGETPSAKARQYLDHLRRRIREYHMEDVVAITDPPEDIPRLLSGFDIFAMPALEEAFSDELIQGMLSGVPCVGTDSGGTPEILERGKVGLLAHPGNSDDLARALVMLMENAEIRSDLGQKARQSARERFGLDTVMPQVEDFYQQT